MCEHLPRIKDSKLPKESLTGATVWNLKPDTFKVEIKYKFVMERVINHWNELEWMDPWSLAGFEARCLLDLT